MVHFNSVVMFLKLHAQYKCVSSVRLWSSIAEWSLDSLGSVTFTPPQPAMTTCSRASSSQRRSSKSSLLGYSWHDKIHILSACTILDTESHLGSLAGDPSVPSAVSMKHTHAVNETLHWGDCDHTLNVIPLVSTVKEMWMRKWWCYCRRLSSIFVTHKVTQTFTFF